MIPDPCSSLASAVRRELTTNRGLLVQPDAVLDPQVAWCPQLYEPASRRAWHLLTHVPESDRWAHRIEAACHQVPELKLAIAAPDALLRVPEVIRAIDALAAAVLPVQQQDASFTVDRERPSILDYIYEEKLRLPHDLARNLLDRALTRAEQVKDRYDKGALLELAVALLLSQVEGFEVSERNISSRTQEVDVNVINRNIAGLLGGSPLVLAEAKNWTAAVDRPEYNAFVAKLRTRRGRAKLGFMITTSRFTQDCYLEHLGERNSEELVVFLDRKRLVRVWNDHRSITEGVEDAIKSAAYDHVPA